MQQTNDVQVAQQILARKTEPFGDQAYVRASNLLNFATSAVFRNGLLTENGLGKLWKQMENAGFEMEWVIDLVTEYVYILGAQAITSEIAPRMAGALSWVKESIGVPKEYSDMSTARDAMIVGFSKNPLTMFLFSLSLCNYNQRLSDVGIARILNKPGK